MLAYAIVNPLVVSAEYDYILTQRERVGHGLVEGLAVGRSEYHLVIFTLLLEMRYGTVYRLNLHHHSGLATKGVVINLTVLVGGVFAEIMHGYLHKPLVLRTLEYRAVERRIYHLGKYGKYIYSHNGTEVF